MESKLLINSSNSTKITLPKQSIKELKWNKDTKLNVERVGKKIIISEVTNNG